MKKGSWFLIIIVNLITVALIIFSLLKNNNQWSVYFPFAIFVFFNLVIILLNSRKKFNIYFGKQGVSLNVVHDILIEEVSKYISDYQLEGVAIHDQLTKIIDDTSEIKDFATIAKNISDILILAFKKDLAMRLELPHDKQEKFLSEKTLSQSFDLIFREK